MTCAMCIAKRYFRALDEHDLEGADSIRKLAALEPSVAWADHAEPVRGDVASQLREVAASAA